MNENVQEICARIHQDAETESKYILEKARQDEEKIINGAMADAERQKGNLLLSLEEEQQNIRERIFSSLNMDKKRIMFDEKKKLAEQVLEEVRKMAADFRKSKEYASFLRQAVGECAHVINTAEIGIRYAAPDEKLINEVVKDKSKYRLIKSDFTDLGVVGQSGDGRQEYDNRFAARLKRKYDELYLELLAAMEAF